MPLHRLIEEETGLGGLGHVGVGLLGGGGAQLGDSLDHVHVDAEHRVDEILGRSRVERPRLALGLEDEHLAGDPVVAVEGRRIDLLRFAHDRVELGGEIAFGLLGEVLEVGVEAVIPDDRGPGRGGRQESVPVAIGQLLQPLVHGNLLGRAEP